LFAHANHQINLEKQSSHLSRNIIFSPNLAALLLNAINLSHIPDQMLDFEMLSFESLSLEQLVFLSPGGGGD
jgi:hypothetical protein